MYRLKSGRYVESEASAAFPKMMVAQLNDFLEQRQRQGENLVIRNVRSWIQTLD